MAPPSLPRIRADIPFPWLDGTMRRSDVLPPFLPRFVASAWQYHPLRLCSSLPFGPTPTKGPGALGLATPTPD